MQNVDSPSVLDIKNLEGIPSPSASIFSLSKFASSYKIQLAILFSIYCGIFVILQLAGHSIPFIMDANESYSSLIHAFNMQNFGVGESMGLTDEAYGPGSGAHPYVYTHQGNFPRLFSFLLCILGANSIEAQTVITTFTVGLIALFFAYRFFSRAGTPLFSFITCLLLLTNYILFTQWHIVTYRVWHIFFFFSTLLCIQGTTSKRKFLWIALTFINYLCLFYYEFVFALFVSLTSALYALFTYRNNWKMIGRAWLVQGSGAAVSVMVLVLQNIAYFGPRDFLKDAYLTFIARNFAFGENTAQFQQQLTDFYNSHHIVFWYNLFDGSTTREFGHFLDSLLQWNFSISTPFFCLLSFMLTIGWMCANSRPEIKFSFAIKKPFFATFLKISTIGILCFLLFQAFRLHMISRLFLNIHFLGITPLIGYALLSKRLKSSLFEYIDKQYWIIRAPCLFLGLLLLSIGPRIFMHISNHPFIGQYSINYSMLLFAYTSCLFILFYNVIFPKRIKALLTTLKGLRESTRVNDLACKLQNIADLGILSWLAIIPSMLAVMTRYFEWGFQFFAVYLLSLPLLISTSLQPNLALKLTRILQSSFSLIVFPIIISILATFLSGYLSVHYAFVGICLLLMFIVLLHLFTDRLLYKRLVDPPSQILKTAKSKMASVALAPIFTSFFQSLDNKDIEWGSKLFVFISLLVSPILVSSVFFSNHYSSVNDLLVSWVMGLTVFSFFISMNADYFYQHVKRMGTSLFIYMLLLSGFHYFMSGVIPGETQFIPFFRLLEIALTFLCLSKFLAKDDKNKPDVSRILLATLLLLLVGFFIRNQFIIYHRYAMWDIWSFVTPAWLSTWLQMVSTLAMGFIMTRIIIQPASAQNHFAILPKRILWFLVSGIIAYGVIYLMFPGYLKTGYLERYVPFGVFVFQVVFAIPIFVLVSIKHFMYISRTNTNEIGRLEKLAHTTTLTLATGLVIILASFWVNMQYKYATLIPPDRFLFLSTLREAPFHKSGFVSNTYAAPLTHFTEQWSYFDPEFASAKVKLTDKGFEMDRDMRTYVWLADRQENKDYLKPKFFVCMLPMSMYFASLELKNEAFPVCRNIEMVKRAKQQDGVKWPASRLVAEDPSKRSAWAIVELDWTEPPFLKTLSKNKNEFFNVVTNFRGDGILKLEINYLYKQRENDPEKNSLIRIYTNKEARGKMNRTDMTLLVEQHVAQPILLPKTFKGNILVSVTPQSIHKKGQEYFANQAFWIENGQILAFVPK